MAASLSGVRGPLVLQGRADEEEEGAILVLLLAGDSAGLQVYKEPANAQTGTTETMLLIIAFLLAGCLGLLQGKASEYQLETETLSRCELLRGVAVAEQRVDVPHCAHDGGFRSVQCSGRGHECWCVDAEGQEIVGTRTNGSAPHCASPCQQQSVLQCSASGLFESVQCSSSRGQCWCVDQDGMELYGTRQSGTPQRCPGSCEVRARRLLHSSPSHSPPQCAADGSFLPVQCQLINATDRKQLDLLQAFTRFPEAFETFGSFRKFFPAVSSFCFCSDSRGRELENTGVELLLSEVYDSAFSGLRSGRSFSQTNVYRVLQRRMLGVLLATTGHFRCPSACEVEREAAMEASSARVPSCGSGGAFSSRQCQQGGPCWCVDPTGRPLTGMELTGTRQMGDTLVCSSGVADCPSRRRQALSRLFSGPVEPPSVRSPASCLSLLRPLKALLPAEADPASFLSGVLVEVLHGVFPSVGGALRALARSPPRRLQENLFGGKFLKNAASFNFSGAVGAQGALSLDWLASQSAALQENRDRVQTVSRVLQDPAFLSALQHTLRSSSSSHASSLQQVLVPLLRSCSEDSDSAAIFVPSCTPSGGFREFQCQDAACWCVDARGQEVAGSRTTGGRPRCPTRCETRRAAALKVRGNMAAGAEVHIPACSQDGDFLPLQCAGQRCFCVDAEGTPTSTGLSCLKSTNETLQSAGRCSRASDEVTAFRQEVQSVIALSNSSHLPLGYGFLLADGLRLTPEELLIDQSEEELRISEQLLSRSRAALRLAAFSTVQMFRPPGNHSFQMFTPQCDADGEWTHTQCYHSTAQCWCVDEEGEFVSDSLISRSVHLPTCLTRCQRAQAHTLLSDWTKGFNITLPHRPECDEDGRFSVLQTGGTAGWCVNRVTGETIQTATPSAAGQLTCPSWCELQGLQCHPDGSFMPLQCDVTSCWCVSEDGQEVGGTRTARLSGRTPSCDRPLCAAAAVTHGALLCRPVANGQQACDLVCHQGYQNSLPVASFLCRTETRQWDGDDRPVGGACQIPQPFQSMSSSQLWSLSASCSQVSSVRSLVFPLMTSRGLCSAQLPVSGRSVSLCDTSSVSVMCDGDAALKLTLTWTAHLSDLPTSELPDLQAVGAFLNESRLLQGVRGLLGNIRSALTSEPDLISATMASFGCSAGYQLLGDGEGCVVCPAGSFSGEGVCLRCPQGTYQDQKGRDFCNRCPRGSSPSGATSVSQCVTECQRRGLRCSERGDFLSAQPDFLSGRWRCVDSKGAGLEWTNRDTPLTDDECSVLSRFQAVPRSDLIVAAEDTEVLQTTTSDLTSCVQACALEPSCHHVALFNRHTQCELYSTHTLNTHCNTSQQTRGFLGNPQAELFDSLSCSLRVRGGASDLLVIRKKGVAFERMKMMKAISGVFRTQVFSSRRTSLSDAHRFCQDGCSRDACCDGFLLQENRLQGGSLLCGWLRAPSVLMCGDQDWDVIGQGTANRICGAGLTYNKQQRSFLLDFGGQKFNITDSSLPADSKNQKDYQASIVSFQAVYLNSDSAADGSGSSSCAAAGLSPPLDASVQQRFQALSQDDVLVEPDRKLPTLSFWLNRKNYNSQQALLWCLSRCDEEQWCAVADLGVGDSAGSFFGCSLFPDSRVCGAYDNPLRGRCRYLLARLPNSTYSKKVDLSGPVKSFYERVSFQKMVSYSVRSRVLLGDTPLTEGFMQCERRCDEDPCCRGFGFVRDTKSPGGSSVVCVSLLSLGVLTCGEDDVTSWRTQDCTETTETRPEPLGWYQKPVNQWPSSPALCPPFSLQSNNVSLDRWNRLPASSVLVDASVSTYDVIHVSRDVASDADVTRDWCLTACQEAESSCVAVSLSETGSATRCVLYPDTTACGLSSAPSTSSPASSCRLVIREPASQVYLRTERLPLVTSISIPGHGTLQGVVKEAVLGSDRKSVVHFLGVPYARPPIGSLRFEAAQPADWSGTWNATKPRPSCLQPGDEDSSSSSSEDCLFLNIFSPAALRGRVPVLVFFFNPSSNQKPGLLDGSTLAAVGNIVVVTASYRTAALGFLSTGPGLRGDYGLSDQEAVLRWVHTHIALVGGDRTAVTVGSERRGADITSLHLLSSSSSPLFQRMMLMGGSVFSPSLVQSSSSSRRQAMALATELGCATSDLTDDHKMAACLRATPASVLNAAQTKLLAASGPFRSWSPVQRPISPAALRRVDLLLGTSEHDGLIGRARRIKDFEALRGRADGKTAFYEALSRSLGGATGSDLLKEAAAWFYSLDHGPSPAGYNLFSRALNNATRDLFIVCPSLQMASHWANSKANVFLYHQPPSSSHDRADSSVPLDVQFVFGTPHRPMSSQRFTSSDRRLSLATMTYVSSFIKTGNPNPSRVWAESVLPRWQPVLSSEAPPTYMELSPALQQRQGLSQSSCSFWSQLGPRLTGQTSQSGVLGAEPIQPELSLAAPSSQSQTEKDGYN
ncbi:thyroglobulin [Clinocottus analis]|uniref:thyroglobulin n=1 Tax=Clinocottus analis TaxID=304258 RepID=UPI0035BF0CE6